MEYQNITPEPVDEPVGQPLKKPGKIRKILSVFMICVLSTVGFFIILAIILAVPRVDAQARAEQSAANQFTTTIRTVFDFIQRNYVEEVDPKQLFEGAMTGMLNSLGDPYSVFLPEAEMRDITDTTQGSFGGIGFYVSKSYRPDGRPSYLEVASLIEDTPGWRSGINSGDLIIEINGESTEPLSSDEAVSRLRGPPGTEVRLLVRRGETIEFPVTIVRAIIEVPTVKHAMIDTIGYLKLLTFTSHTVERSQDAIRDFQSAGYKGIILDLRNNYGGLLSSAVDVSNLFLDGGIVVTTKPRQDSGNQVYRARSGTTVPVEVPMVVLINRGSASASEIVAGALKDRGRAYLVGEKSYGKGSVQQVYPLDNVGFKITIARYYTPSNVNIDIVGIPPDREILFPVYTEVDAAGLNSLINSGKISDFIKANPEADNRSITAFAEQMHGEYDLEVSLLKTLIQEEKNRRSTAPVYDLDYDVQLQEAMKILTEENFQILMRSAKTLKTLQEEAMQEEDFALAS
jgi:carboxyl-terminal processing protease